MLRNQMIEIYDMAKDLDRNNLKQRTRFRAMRRHQGNTHWHAERRSSVVICRECGARIP